MTLSRSALARVFKKNNLLEEFREQEAVFAWTEVAGELGKVARPRKVSGSSLILEVPSAAAKQELSFLEDQFLEKLNENLRETRIEKLRFELGEFRDEPDNRAIDLDSVTLTDEEIEKIDGAVDDSGLEGPARESLRRLLLTQQRKRKQRLESGWNECPACGGVFPDKRCPYCGFPFREVDTGRANP